MDRVVLLLHISLALLTSAAGLVFAIAEESPIPALTIPLAILTFVFVDRQKTLRLPPLAINIIGVAAFFLAAVELVGENIEARLLSGGHLLVYLTWAFLFQEKGSRQVWWLCGLSVLQIAVSSLLTYSPWFGAIMPLFLLLAMWTLSVFQIARAADIMQKNSVAGRRETGLRERGYQFGARSSAAGASTLDPRCSWISRRFVFSTFAMTLASTMLAALFFLFIPRVWQRNMPVAFLAGREIGGAPSSTGFTDTISLGQIGQIQESPRIALTAKFYDREEDRTLTPQEWSSILGGPIRFRGSVQENYESGTWRRISRRTSDRQRSDFQRLMSPRSRLSVSVQLFLNGNDETQVLFASGMPLSLESISPRREVLIERTGWIVEASWAGQLSRTLDYTFNIAIQDPWFPNREGLSPFRGNLRESPSTRQVYVDYLDRCLNIPSSLRMHLQQWKSRHGPESAGSRPSTEYELARFWESRLSDSRDFEYSLAMRVQDPTLDPVADFLLNRRRGHCEYFASALAMLLRSEGIPTRVVSGYMGGTTNPTTGQWEVRDLHAHAWVEAFVENGLPEKESRIPGGAWITLDPTPAARETLVQQQELQASSLLFQLKDGWRSLWSTAIRMNQGEQQSLIYEPLKQSTLSTWSALSEVFSGRLSNFRRFLASPREWFSWQGGITVFVLLLLLSGIIWGLRKLMSLFRRERIGNRQSEAAVVVIPFYQQLEKLLARAGFIRRASQTPREFMLSTAPALPESLSAELRRLPADVTDQFYSVRYGHAPISPVEAAHIEDRLARLEEGLK